MTENRMERQIRNLEQAQLVVGHVNCRCRHPFAITTFDQTRDVRLVITGYLQRRVGTYR